MSKTTKSPAVASIGLADRTAWWSVTFKVI